MALDQMGVVEWGVLGTVVSILVGIIGIVIKLMDRLNKAEARAESAGINVAAARLEIERVEADLVNHRVDVAREYVSKDTLANFETRIVEAINRLGDRLDKMLASR